jgi:hypothetical protein
MHNDSPPPFFFEPRPDAASLAAIGDAIAHTVDLVPPLATLFSRLAHPSTEGWRELFLDAAAVLLAEADRQWARGRVLQALALEGLEARLLEQIVCPEGSRVARRYS